MASGPQFASLYVGDLNPDVTEAMLYETFNTVGPVGSIRICRDSVTRKSLGYGYVNFQSAKDAEKALETLNYSTIKGRSCRIMKCQRDPSARKGGAGNIFVGNLDPNIDNKALYDTFSLFGTIESCKVAADRVGKSRGYGFVHFESDDAAKQAIEKVNGMKIGENIVEVALFVKRDKPTAISDVSFTNTYVKNFPDDWDESKLLEFFKEYGPITAQRIYSDPSGRKYAFINFEKTEMAQKAVQDLHKKDIRSDEQKAADEGKEPELDADGNPMNLLYVARHKSKVERQRERAKAAPAASKGAGKGPPGVNLFVKNLDEDTGDAELKELFEQYGTITSAAAMKDDKGKCKGFGFVCFATPDEATRAVTELHLKVVKGKPLYVGLAEKREDRQERLRQRYTPGQFGGKGSKGKGKGGYGKGGGYQDMGGPMQQQGGYGKGGYQDMGGHQDMGGGMQQQAMMMGKGMPGMGMGMQAQQQAQQQQAMQQQAMMMGKGMHPMMANPQMMAMMGKGNPMMQNPQQAQMMAMMGKGGPMMPNPQMMAMMGKGMPGKGMPGMPGMMPPNMMGQRPPMPQQQAAGPNAPISAAALAAAPPQVQKQMLGTKLYPKIAKYQPDLAGKITGMMLEMDNSELLIMLESDAQLKQKIDEAMRVLQAK